MNKSLKTLGVFSLVMITVNSVDNIRNLPTTALFGSSLIFYFVLAAFCFLLPGALIAAELASGSNKTGGIYNWVKTAFGTKTGFLAVWFQWIENVIWYPTILSFVAGTVGYLVAPQLAESKYFLMAVILVAFWGATIINLYGIKSSARFSSFCVIGGVFVPMAVIMVLGVMWVVGGHPVQIQFGWHEILPNVHKPDTWVALTGIILSFCGIEIATVHGGDVHNPQKAYPRAMWISTIILLITLMFGSLAIAIVLPEKQISLVAGLMQAYSAFFGAYHMHWILPLIAVMLVLGAMGSVSNWIIAPTRGLVVAARDGNLPQWCQQENAHGAPKALLITQSVIVTLIAGVFLLMPSVNGSYWLLTVLAAQLYMFMYILMFSAAIKLRYKNWRENTGFQIPGGKFGIWFVGLLGLLASLATVIIGFIPPSGINTGGTMHYEVMLVIGLLVMSAPPFIFHILRKRGS